MSSASSATEAANRRSTNDLHWWLVQTSIDQSNGLPELSTEQFDLVFAYLCAMEAGR